MLYNITTKVAKSKEKLLARKYRKQGKSIKFIASRLSVSPSTASVWCKDIELTQDQINQLEKQARDPMYGRRLLNVRKQQKARLMKIEQLRNMGIKEIGRMNKRELFLFGVALYWSEGFKKDNQVGFANSNPDMIKIFIKWLVDCCGIDPDNLTYRVTINRSHQHRVGEIHKYWIDVCMAQETQFQKPFYQNVVWKKQYENPNDYYGVLRVRVRKSTDFLRRIHGWIEGSKSVIDMGLLR